MNITSIFADSAEFPTLLHFAACHGLEKLSNVLMDCLGFNDAIQMRNVSEMTPAELGITYNFHEKKPSFFLNFQFHELLFIQF